MKKLIVLMIVLIPVAVFAAKDASSSSIYPKGMEDLCQDLKNVAHVAATAYFGHSWRAAEQEIKNLDKAQKVEAASDQALEQAAKVSTVYSALCK